VQKKKRIDLPTYKEMFEHARELENDAQPSLTPHTSHYLHQEELAHKKDCVQVYNEVIESLELLDIERFGEGDLSVISAMEPADGEKYLNDRLDTLGNINKYLTDMMEKIELRLVEHLNSYNEGE